MANNSSGSSKQVRAVHVAALDIRGCGNSCSSSQQAAVATNNSEFSKQVLAAHVAALAIRASGSLSGCQAKGAKNSNWPLYTYEAAAELNR